MPATARLLALLSLLASLLVLLTGPAARGDDPAPKYPTGAKPSAPQAIASAPRFLPDGKLGAPAQYARVPKRISMWGNDRFGDCVTVEECFAKIADFPHIWVTEQECIEWARRHGVLNGATLVEVLDAMRRDGIRAEDGKLYKNGQHFTVNYRDKETLANALYKGTVKIAIASGQVQAALNRTGGRSGWHGVNWRVDNVDRWGGPKADHSVPLCGYGPAAFLYEQLGLPLPAGVRPGEYGYLMFTWNSIGFVSHQSLVNVCVEAWVRDPTTDGFPEPTPQPDPGPTPPPVPVDPPTPAPDGGTPGYVWYVAAAAGGFVFGVVLIAYVIGARLRKTVLGVAVLAGLCLAGAAQASAQGPRAVPIPKPPGGGKLVLKSTPYAEVLSRIKQGEKLIVIVRPPVVRTSFPIKLGWTTLRCDDALLGAGVWRCELGANRTPYATCTEQFLRIPQTAEDWYWHLNPPGSMYQWTPGANCGPRG